MASPRVEPIDFLDDVVRLNERAVAVVVHGVLHAQLVAVPMPGRPIALEVLRLAVVQQCAQRLGHEADMIPIDALDLVDLGRIDVEVRDELGAAGKFGDVAGDTIVESRTKSEQAIAIIDGVVGEGGAVHAEHAHGQRIAWCRRRRFPSGW